MKNIIRFALLTILLTTFFAAVPQLMHFQGQFLDVEGTVYHGPHTVTFLLYDDEVGGTHIWSEIQELNLHNGHLSAYLGEVTPIPASIFNDDVKYLEVQIDGTPFSRSALITVPYAFRANYADSVDFVSSVRSIDTIYHIETVGTVTHIDSIHHLDTVSFIGEINYVAEIGYIDSVGYTRWADSAHWAGYVHWDSIDGIPGDIGGDSDWQVDGDDMYAMPSGNIGIGTVSPATENKLHIVSDGTSGDKAVHGEYSGSGPQGWLGAENYGAYGQYDSENYGALGSSGIGIHARGATNAAVLEGDVNITGNVTLGSGAQLFVDGDPGSEDVLMSDASGELYWGDGSGVSGDVVNSLNTLTGDLNIVGGGAIEVTEVADDIIIDLTLEAGDCAGIDDLTGGSATNDNVPITLTSISPAVGQFLLKSDEIACTGGRIQGLTFYHEATISSEVVATGFDLYLDNVIIEDLEDVNPLYGTPVAINSPLHIYPDGSAVIEFTHSFYYEGDNLLITVVKNDGYGNMISWSGHSTIEVMARYNESSCSYPLPSESNFRPDISIDYTAPDFPDVVTTLNSESGDISLIAGEGIDISTTTGSITVSSTISEDADWEVSTAIGDGSSDTTLVMGGKWGIFRSGSGGYGNACSTHVNLGVDCSTGVWDSDFKYVTISGGRWNQSAGHNSTIGGGRRNIIDADDAVIAGGAMNRVTSDYGTISGGAENQLYGNYAIIAGGQQNYINVDAISSAIIGGKGDTISGEYSSILGGSLNEIGGNYSSIIGGYFNFISGDYSIAFGNECDVSSDYTARFFSPSYPGSLLVAGDVHFSGAYKDSDGDPGTSGQVLSSTETGTDWVDGGGISNWTYSDDVLETNDYWAIAKGNAGNILTGTAKSTHINLGVNCTTSASNVTIGGGQSNTASDGYATISGGLNNRALEWCSTIGGGSTNITTGNYSTIAGGYQITANGLGATSPGGTYTDIIGDKTFAFGIGSSSDRVNVPDSFDVVFFTSDVGRAFEFGVNTENPEYAMHIVGDSYISGRYHDSDGDPGISGQVLSSTGSGTNWVTGGSGTADNWGSQTVQSSSEFSGNGTSSSPLELAQQGASDGQVLKWNDASSNWEPADDEGSGTGTGDITSVTAGSGLSGGGTSGDVTLYANFGSSSGTICQGNDYRLSNSRTPTGSAGGDLSGTYPSPTVDGLQGRPVSSSYPSSNYVLKWYGGQWTPRPDETGSSSTPTIYQVLGAGYDAGGRDIIDLDDLEADNIGAGTSATYEAAIKAESSYHGVSGHTTNSGYCGVRGEYNGYVGAIGHGKNGVYGHCANTSTLDAAGVLGKLVDTSNSTKGALGYMGSGGQYIGVYGYSGTTGTRYAGYFNGNVNVTGSFDAGTKDFLIDHPDDPYNKILRHHCVESPEYLCVYRGKVKLNSDGEASVEMPHYYKSLADEEGATVHPTPVGRPFMVGYEWDNDFLSFTLYGDPNREVSYLVYAERDDPTMNYLWKPIEQEKGPDGPILKGHLLVPEAYGQERKPLKELPDDHLDE